MAKPYDELDTSHGRHLKHIFTDGSSECSWKSLSATFRMETSSDSTSHTLATSSPQIGFKQRFGNDGKLVIGSALSVADFTDVENVIGSKFFKSVVN